MLKLAMVLVMGCGALMVGCAQEQDVGTPEELGSTDETQEIVANLVAAGFPADDIQVVDGLVYTGRDALVTLQASREMLQAPAGPEQYRTTNLVSSSVTLICVIGKQFSGVFDTGLNLAIENYNQ
ncbi:MAG TPA: M57 family metalloprotease, partial [Polyangiaceae bacterium]|nr:M57 family metalloprotease [Polyangiaceae bacterium]